MSPTRHLVVCGGNGFLGSRICRSAVAQNFKVTSISRRGAPDWNTLWKLSAAPAWASQVDWHRGDVFDPSTYSDKLEGATAVVHTMGILLEQDYKGVLTGKEPLVSGFRKAFSGEEKKDGKLTYEKMNRESALILARTAISHSVPTFLYVSAADGFVLLPSRYISTKRDAERILPTLSSDMRTILVRPAFIYDSTRPISLPLAFATGITSSVNSLFGGKLPLLGAAGQKPLKVDVVAEAVVQAIQDEGVSGVIDIPKIETLATKAWRAAML
ncbi:hypothetical protein BDZ91DRAFT_708371 [Kalaharituber pfeilii]|nr:hypothetical protein BDZ91DRAFT_708371 [Kalaharituber pfeilii]